MNQRISVRADRIIAVQRIERAAPDVVAVAPPLGNDDLYIRILAAGSRNDPLEPVGEIACCERVVETESAVGLNSGWPNVQNVDIFEVDVRPFRRNCVVLLIVREVHPCC